MDALTNHPPLADRLALDHEALASEIEQALAGLEASDVASDDDVLEAREKVKPLRTLLTSVEAAFKAEKAPFLEGGRTVDGFFKELRAGLDQMINAITLKVNAYQTKKREEARKLEAAKARIAAAVGEAAPAPAAPKETVRVAVGEAAKVSGTVRWDYEIVDTAALPRDLLMPNEAAIKARVAGMKATLKSIDDANIPGLRIYEKVGTTWR